MTLQLILYFSSILVTCALTGFLSWYAWKHRDVPGSGTFALLALSECFLALTEILSVLSPTQALAMFWFEVRFIPQSIFLVMWLVFTLEYGYQNNFISKRLLASLFIIPVVSQVLLWSNSLHGLWLQQEVSFRRSGLFWLSDIHNRIPGPGFLVYAFYGLILHLAGIVLLLGTAWRMHRQYRGQALLLTGAGITSFVFGVNTIVKLIPSTEFNPFVPGLGLSVLLIALAVFRFQFLKRAPAQENAASLTNIKPQEYRSLAVFFLIFILFVSALAAAGYLTYQNYEKQFRAQIETQLSAIARLKMNELETWRSERLGDAEMFYQNPAFTALVQRYFANPADAQSQTQLQTWLDKSQVNYHYMNITLLDNQSVERISAPAAAQPPNDYLVHQAAVALASGQVTMLDFHRDTPTDSIHLTILVPILDMQDSGPLGVLVLRIDPNIYLYPLLQQWPTPSQSAETLLVRRDGESVLFLNPLRFQPNAALNLRVPLTDTQVLAVQSATGAVGVVEGRDYRNVAVIGYVGAIPDSPWFLVARMDSAEVYAPLRERLWLALAFFGALFLAASAGLLLIWRQQEMRYYRAQYETSEMLRKSEEQYHELIEHASDGVFIADANRKYVEVNPSGCAMLGYHREEILAKRISDLIAPEDLKTARILLDELQQGKTMLTEQHLIRKDGSLLPVEISGRMLPDGRFQSIIRDITARKQAETQLMERHATLNAILESSATPVFSLDRDCRYTSFNQAHAAVMKVLFGAEIEIGKNMLAYQAVSTDRETARKNLDRALHGEQIIEAAYSGEPGRTQRYFEITHNPIREISGEIIGVSVFVSDITERKQAEEALQGYNARLEADVAARTQELRQAQEKLLRQERLATLGQLAGSIAHELRNPLGVISNAVYYLNQIQPQAGPRLQEYLAIIENETRSAEKIITDLLDHSRIKAPNRQPTQVADLAQRALARYSLAPNVHLALDLSAELPPVSVDPDQMVQVLGNLLTNACQAMPDGGELALAAHLDGPYATITVADNGMGIAPENMSKLFEPLFTTKFKGIGLGLSLSKSLVEANDGRIEVQSELGRGSTFTLHLPVHKPVVSEG